MNESPRILIQGGSYELDNLGDVSMLEALIERVTLAQPNARIALFSRNATQARRILADIELVPVEGKRPWRLVHDGYLQLRRALPIVDKSFRFLLPRVYENLLHRRRREICREIVGDIGEIFIRALGSLPRHLGNGVLPTPPILS